MKDCEVRLINAEPNYFKAGKTVDVYNEFFQSFEKLTFSRKEGKVGWREDQERISLFNPGLNL